jgi:hypothetical protein
MKVSNFIEKLEKIKEEYGDLQLVYSSDDEGNRFEKVHYSPSAGCYVEQSGEWLGGVDLEEKNDELDKDEEQFKFNSVCIN